MQHRMFNYSMHTYYFVYKYRTVLLTMIILAVLLAMVIAPGVVEASHPAGGSTGGG